MTSGIPVSQSSYPYIIFALIFGPPAMRLLLAVLHYALPFLAPGAKSFDLQRRKVVQLLLFKALIYAVTFFTLLPVTLRMARELSRDGRDAGVAAVAGAFWNALPCMVLYIFELTWNPALGAQVLLHHIGALVPYAVLLSGTILNDTYSVLFTLTVLVVGLQVTMLSCVLFAGIAASMSMPAGRKKGMLLGAVGVFHGLLTACIFCMGVVGLALSGPRISAAAVVICALTAFAASLANTMLVISTMQHAKKALRADVKKVSFSSASEDDANSSSDKVQSAISTEVC